MIKSRKQTSDTKGTSSNPTLSKKRDRPSFPEDKKGNTVSLYFGRIRKKHGGSEKEKKSEKNLQPIADEKKKGCLRWVIPLTRATFESRLNEGQVDRRSPKQIPTQILETEEKGDSAAKKKEDWNWRSSFTETA